MKERLKRVPVLGTAIRVQERYVDDAADQLAAAIGFFAFLSLFPLLILAVSAIGYALDDPARQQQVVTTVTEAIPGLAATMGDGDTGVATLMDNVVENRGAIGLVGGISLLLTGLRVVNAAMTATTVALRGTVPKGIGAKVKQLGVLVALGIVAAAGVAGASLAGVAEGLLPSWAMTLVALGLSFVLDVGLFWAAYALLRGDAPVRARSLLPGAVLGAVGWTALKVAGAAYVGSQMSSANAVYGALGGIIALLLLFYLAGRLYLYGAELSALRVEDRIGALEHYARRGQDATARQEPAEPVPAASARTPGGGRASGSVPGPHPAATAAAATDAPAAPVAVAPEAAAPEAVAPAAVAPRSDALDAHATSPTVRAATRARLAEAERGREQSADVRGAVGFALAVGAVAAGLRWLRED